MGVSHADDLQYLFFSPDYLLETPEEFAVKSKISWCPHGPKSNFATYGDPTPPGSTYP